MKTQISNSMNSLAWRYLVIVTMLLVAFTYAQRCVAQQKPGWTLVFDDEFNELNNGGTVNDLFAPSGLWYSLAQGWNPVGVGSEYDSPVPPWNPAGCNNPTINTALTSSGTLDLTVRKNPGNYAVWKFTSAGGSVVCSPYTYTGSHNVVEADFSIWLL